MRTSWFSGLLVLLAFATLWACRTGDLDVGQSVINPQELDVQAIDTVTIQTSTIAVFESYTTSATTSADTNMLVGNWNDANTGKLTARGFSSLGYPSNSLQGAANLQLDSLVLELGYTYSYGDTSKVFNLAIHQLRQPLDPSIYYLNNSVVAYDEKPLFQRSFLLRPNTGTRRIRFRIPDATAREFYSRLLSGDINSVTTMNEYWKGFALASSTTENLFAAFSAFRASGLRLYYRDISGVTQTANTLYFPFGTANYSQFLADRSGTPLASLQTRTDAVSSTQTGQQTYVSRGVGLRTKITFPYLGQFDRPEAYAGLNGATLILGPIRRSLFDNTTPPAQLYLYESNSQNELIGLVPAGNLGSAQPGATYFFDNRGPEFLDSYTFDLTYYIGQVIRRKLPNRPLIVTTSSVNPTRPGDLRALVQRLSLGSGQRSTDRMRLRLYITSGI
jgi:hypothetical protein